MDLPDQKCRYGMFNVSCKIKEKKSKQNVKTTCNLIPTFSTLCDIRLYSIFIVSFLRRVYNTPINFKTEKWVECT